MADTGGRQAIAGQISDIDGKLDILINNAGTAWGDRYVDYPTEAFDKVLELNVTTVFAMTRDLTPLLEQA
ncbi:SDR family NAD(P)-dependent oxidoreductase, partial [Brevundimonas sp.]|uniref:SDR family NAD(P)-dependent oxidoreductase n=1 Tax=Brevundimonas sp. TaxID=1871086 RepID=UPI0035143642